MSRLRRDSDRSVSSRRAGEAPVLLPRFIIITRKSCAFENVYSHLFMLLWKKCFHLSRPPFVSHPFISVIGSDSSASLLSGSHCRVLFFTSGRALLAVFERLRHTSLSFHPAGEDGDGTAGCAVNLPLMFF